MILRLKKNKIDVKHIRVEINIITINDTIWPVLAFCHLFILDLQLTNKLLFGLNNRAAFAC